MSKDLGTKIKGIIDQGAFDLTADADASVPIITGRQIENLLINIRGMINKGFDNVALGGNGGIAFPPNSLKFAVAMLEPTSGQRVGMLRWKKGRGLFIRIKALEAIALDIRPNGSLADVVRAFQKNNWQVKDVDFSTTPCAPFFRDEPVITEQTAIMMATSLGDVAMAKSLLDQASNQMRQQAWDDAARSFDQALELNPGDADGWAGKAGALMMVKRWTEVMSCCDNALIIKPDHPGAWFNKGICFANGLNNIPEALRCFRKAEQLGMREASTVIRQLEGGRR